MPLVLDKIHAMPDRRRIEIDEIFKIPVSRLVFMMRIHRSETVSSSRAY
jgi:hypothetical protein